MTNEVKNVPEIRFPEFDDEWKEKKFYECVEIEGKLVNPNFHEYQNLPHIGPGNIQKNTGRILNYNLVKDENLISGKFEFDEEDIIYGKINPQLQKICIPGFRGLASADTYPIKTISGVSNTYFIYYSLFTSRFFKYSVSVSMRTGMPKINKEELGSYNFYLPKIMEQQKIGGFFSKLDRQIELEEQKLAKLEEQKKGYMQQIFSQKLRFKDENNNDYPEWKEQKLYEVVKYLSSKRSSNNYSENIMQGDYPVYDAIQEISKDVNFDIKEPYISILKDGAGVGRLNLRPGKSSVIGTMGYLLPENIDINFLFYYLKTMNFNKFVIGSTIPHLYFKDYSKETIFVPKNEEEQFKIGSFFIKLDKVIENKSDKIELLKERKKGFLQRMFV